MRFPDGFLIQKTQKKAGELDSKFVKGKIAGQGLGKQQL
jgi:hypothetical protein